MASALIVVVKKDAFAMYVSNARDVMSHVHGSVPAILSLS
jgi:hypothetical protein